MIKHAMKLLATQPIKILVLTILMVGLMASVAAPAEAKSKGTDRPFKGKATGESTVPIVVDSGPTFVMFETEGSGTFNATHMGKGTYSGTSTQLWTGGNCGVVAGSITLTAANGDTVEGVIGDGSVVCEVAPNDLSTYESELNINIVGGTGRFEGASGSFVSNSTHTRDVVPEISLSVDTGKWLGKISYSKKKSKK